MAGEAAGPGPRFFLDHGLGAVVVPRAFGRVCSFLAGKLSSGRLDDRHPTVQVTVDVPSK